ncbi:MAG: hypothetical protein D3904_10920 [Candidatus Electrothrix sp. EH2]|nr:hypothetical protein [Candidatus Electrothrix sp. EH2]
MKNAVILQDISRPRLKGHLLRQGLDDLWNMLEQSENEADLVPSSPGAAGQKEEQPQSLLELARRPLFLGIMIGVAEKLRKGFKRRQGESWEDLLWRLYLNDCLAPRTPPPNEPPDEHDRKYAQARSRHWLHCLARWMQAEDKVALQIDELQPGMLIHYWLFGLLYGMIYGLALTLCFMLSTDLSPLVCVSLVLPFGMILGVPGLMGRTIFGKLVSSFDLPGGMYSMMTRNKKQIKVESLHSFRLPASRQKCCTFIGRLLVWLIVGVFLSLVTPFFYTLLTLLWDPIMELEESTRVMLYASAQS